MPANIRELKLAFSKTKQADLATATSVADMFGVSSRSDAAINVLYNKEDDANDIGKGDEFAANVFPLNWDVNGGLEFYLTSLMLAHAGVFTFGKFAKTTPASGAFQYVCTLSDPVSDGIDCPAFTVAQAIRPGGSNVDDRLLIGCCYEEMNIHLANGPGRENATLSTSLAGTGKNTTPSGITFPAVAVQKNLNSGGFTTLTIMGTDYIAGKNLLSLDFGLKKNIRLDQGYFVGSGSQSNAALRGRMMHGDRQISLRASVLIDAGAPEYAAMIAGTEGTVSAVNQGALITGSTYHGFTLSLARVAIKLAPLGNDRGLVKRDIEFSILKHASNGIGSLTVITDVDGIGATAT
jgi:hypothetical protein